MRKETTVYPMRGDVNFRPPLRRARGERGTRPEIIGAEVRLLYEADPTRADVTAIDAGLAAARARERLGGRPRKLAFPGAAGQKMADLRSERHYDSRLYVSHGRDLG